MNILTDEEIVQACNATGLTALLNMLRVACTMMIRSLLLRVFMMEYGGNTGEPIH